MANIREMDEAGSPVLEALMMRPPNDPQLGAERFLLFFFFVFFFGVAGQSDCQVHHVSAKDVPTGSHWAPGGLGWDGMKIPTMRVSAMI